MQGVVLSCSYLTATVREKEEGRIHWPVSCPDGSVPTVYIMSDQATSPTKPTAVSAAAKACA